MSQPLRVAYAHPKDAIVIGSDYNVIFASGVTVPTDASAGFSPGCIYIDRDAAAGSQFFINEGTAASCDFNALAVSAFSGIFTTLTAANNASLITNTTAGLYLASNANQKLGFWGATPIVKPASAGETAGAAGLGNNIAGASVYVTNTTNFTGNTGSTAYSINDLVKNLKLAGILTS